MSLPIFSPALKPEQIEKLLTLQRQVYDLRLKRDSTLVQNETLKQNIDALKESVEDYKKIVEEKESKDRRLLKNIMDGMKKDQNALGRQVAFYDGQYSKLEKELVEADRQLEALGVANKNFENWIASLDREIEHVVSDISGGAQNEVLVTAVKMLADRLITPQSAGFEALRSQIMKTQDLDEGKNEEEADGKEAPTDGAESAAK